MIIKRKNLIYIAAAIILIASFVIRGLSTSSVHPREYKEIEKSGVLRAVTEYNSVSYYVDGDTLAGFSYELLKRFAEAKGLKLEITPEMSYEQRRLDLEKGKYDIIADNNVTTSELKDSLLFTRPIILNKQILVQRKRELVSDSVYISTQLDLSKKTLNVVKGSPAISRIHNLSNEIGDTINIHQIDKYGQEQLLALVASGDIDYAVCDEFIAKASLKDFPQLDISTPISFTLFYSWGINKKSKTLLDTLDTWLNHFITTKEFEELNRKYYNK